MCIVHILIVIRFSSIICVQYSLLKYYFFFRTLLENSDWLQNELGDVDDDYVLFDCPGQIELYTHLPLMKKLVQLLEEWNFRICVVFMIDSQFLVDGAKFLSGKLFYNFHKDFLNGISIYKLLSIIHLYYEAILLMGFWIL